MCKLANVLLPVRAESVQPETFVWNLPRYFKRVAISGVTIGAVPMIGAKVIVWLFVASAVVKPFVPIPGRAIGPHPPAVSLVAVGATNPAALVERPRVAACEDGVVVLGVAVDGCQVGALRFTGRLGLIPVGWPLIGFVARCPE